MRKTESKANQQMIFQIWRVLMPLSKSTKFDGLRCETEIVATKEDLSKACSEMYGVGDFVGLQKSKSGEGFALSHWVIKVRPNDAHNSLCVSPNVKYLAWIRRQPREGVEGFLFPFHEQLEAAITSFYLKEMSDPVEQSTKEDTCTKYIKRLIQAKESRSSIIEKLISKGAIFWPSYPSERYRVNAETAYNSTKRAIRREKQPKNNQKVKQVNKKAEKKT